MPVHGPWLTPVGSGYADIYPAAATPVAGTAYDSFDNYPTDPPGFTGGWDSARKGQSVADGTGAHYSGAVQGFELQHIVHPPDGSHPSPWDTRYYYAGQLLCAADISRVTPDMLPPYVDRTQPPHTSVEYESPNGTLVPSPHVRFKVAAPFYATDPPGSSDPVPLDSVRLYQMTPADVGAWAGGTATPPAMFLDPDTIANLIGETAPVTPVGGVLPPSPVYDEVFHVTGSQVFCLVLLKSLTESPMPYNGSGFTAGLSLVQSVPTARIYVEYTGPRFRWVYDVLPRLRQFPRDDFLGGAPRQGHGSTSVQASARQGWKATYR